MKTETELKAMFQEKIQLLQENPTPQMAVILNVEIRLLREILGDKLPEGMRE